MYAIAGTGTLSNITGPGGARLRRRALEVGVDGPVPGR